VNWAKTIKAIRHHRSFLLSTHIHADFDAIASELAMALYLKSLGKKITVINAEELSKRFHFMPGCHLIQSFKDSLKRRLDYEAAIIMDCGDLDRIDKVRSLIKKDRLIINIDHHLTNDLFGHLNCIDPKASSTAEVLFRLFKKANFPLTRDIALLLYLGVMTDTGSFRYDTTTFYTHQMVSHLMKFDFSASELYRLVYERVDFDDLRLFLKVMSSLDRLWGGKVICIEMPQKLSKRFSPEFDVRDKIFNLLRSLKDLEVVMILTQETPDQTRVNFRAPGDRVNVAELASFFKGGGHRRASGCVIAASLPEAKKQVFFRLEKLL